MKIVQFEGGRNRKALSKVTIVLIAAIGLSSCGSSSLASSKTTTTTSASSSQASYQACLTAHGFVFPKYSQNSKTPPTTVAASVRQAAINACSNGSTKRVFSKPSATQLKAIKAYTLCLQQHGVTIPTTTTGANGTSSYRKGLAGLRALSGSSQFASASKACASLRPSFAGHFKSSSISTTTTVAG